MYPYKTRRDDHVRLSIVGDIGFSRLVPDILYLVESISLRMSWRYFMMMFNRKWRINWLVLITSTSRVISPYSLMSLTAHWSTNEFVRKRAILHAQNFDGSLTGAEIHRKFTEMFKNWGIQEEKVHLVIICDNGSNMVKALNDAFLPHFGCFDHTLQLVVHDAVLSHWYIVYM